jgi:hypothetical protein
MTRKMSEFSTLCDSRRYIAVHDSHQEDTIKCKDSRKREEAKNLKAPHHGASSLVSSSAVARGKTVVSVGTDRVAVTRRTKSLHMGAQ